MLELMLRTMVVGAFATAAALLFERGLAHLGVGRRHAWTFALLATALLPFLPQFTETARVPDVVPTIGANEIVLRATSNVASGLSFDVGLAAWLVLSAIVCMAYLISFVRLLHVRRSWRPAQIARQAVFLSDRFGPAVFGFVRPHIVVPRWVEESPAAEQELIVLHEREHIRARDQLQLLLAIAATATMPWNPFAWIQARRLRFTIEADCDQRVLAAAPDRATYASLLVNVGSRQMGLLLTPALAEHRNGLERRLGMLAQQLIRNRWKAAGLFVIGLLVAGVACESRLPSEQPQPDARGNLSDQSLPRKTKGSPPAQPTMGELVARHYPPLLREAGIGGTVGVEVTVRTDATKDSYYVVKTSGHEALDQAAMKVVREMQLLPRRVPAGQQPKDETYRIFVEFSPQAQAQPAPQTEPAPWTNGSARPRVKTFLDWENPPYSRKPELSNREEIGQAVNAHYPPLLRSAGIGGRVITNVLVDEHGNVGDVSINGQKNSSGHRALDSAAIRVARQMKFVPAAYQGEPIKVWIALPIVFKS